MHLFLNTPKVQLTLFLILIYTTALIRFPTFASLYVLFTTLVFTIFFDLLFTFIRRKTLFIPFAAIVTSLIIALLIDPAASWYQIGLISAIAMGSKNYIRISGRHIFNPAAMGLFLGGIILNLGVAWWGVSFQNISKLSIENLTFFFILLLPALVSAYRMRRSGSILSFIVLYAVLTSVSDLSLLPKSLLSTLLNPATLFFAIVMLPEPMTSPVNLKRQILYGTTVVLIILALSYPPVINLLSNHNLLPDLFTPALLLANLIFFRYR